MYDASVTAAPVLLQYKFSYLKFYSVVKCFCNENNVARYVMGHEVTDEGMFK